LKPILRLRLENPMEASADQPTEKIKKGFRWNPFFYFGGGCPTLVELPLLVQQGFPVMWRIADLDPWLIL